MRSPYELEDEIAGLCVKLRDAHLEIASRDRKLDELHRELRTLHLKWDSKYHYSSEIAFKQCADDLRLTLAERMPLANGSVVLVGPAGDDPLRGTK
jgi:hypothetical protein